MYKLILFFIGCFIAIGYIVVIYGGFEVDGYVSSHIHLIYSDTLTLVAKTLSFIGGMKESLLLSFVFVVWLVYKKRWIYEAKLYTTSLILSISSFAIIKQLVARERPHSTLIEAYNYSFPSGHSTMAMGMALGVYMVFANKIKYRYALLIGAISWAILVGFSRIYLNVHWVSDVLAGLSLGVVCAMVSYKYVSK